MSLESSFNLDFQAFINNNLAVVVASLIALMTIAMFRAIGAEQCAVRLLRAVWADVAHLAGRRDEARSSGVRPPHGRPPRPACAPVGRIAAGLYLHAADMLGDIRVGLNIADVQRERAGLSAPEMKICQTLLAGLGEHFQNKLARAALQAGPAMLARIDSAIAPADFRPYGGGHHPAARFGGNAAAASIRPRRNLSWRDYP